MIVSGLEKFNQPYSFCHQYARNEIAEISYRAMQDISDTCLQHPDLTVTGWIPGSIIVTAVHWECGRRLGAGTCIVGQYNISQKTARWLVATDILQRNPTIPCPKIVYRHRATIDGTAIGKRHTYRFERVAGIGACSRRTIGQPPHIIIKLGLVRDTIFCLPWRQFGRRVRQYGKDRRQCRTDNYIEAIGGC
jgi:hypothetical protein